MDEDYNTFTLHFGYHCTVCAPEKRVEYTIGNHGVWGTDQPKAAFQNPPNKCPAHSHDDSLEYLFLVGTKWAPFDMSKPIMKRHIVPISTVRPIHLTPFERFVHETLRAAEEGKL